jgi:hypothetical protein
MELSYGREMCPLLLLYVYMAVIKRLYFPLKFKMALLTLDDNMEIVAYPY